MALARNIATVGAGTLMSRLLAYVRDAGIAALLGATAFSDGLFAVMQVINFFRRLLAEGALNGAFVPIWLKLREGEDGEANADRFTRRTLLAMFCIASILALAVYLLSPLLIAGVAPGFDEGRQAIAEILLRIAAPYVLLSGMTAVIASALNAERRVIAVTISTAMFNVVMVVAVAMAFDDQLASFEKSLVLALAITVAALVQLCITGITWLMTGKRWRRANVHALAETAAFFRRVAPGLIAAGIPQLKLIAATAIVSSSEAAVTWLYYANRLYELPLGVASIAIAAVIVPHLAASRHAGDASGEAQSRAYEIALGLALPAAAGFALLATPIAAALFERGVFRAEDTAAVAAALTAICAGLPGHVLEKVFAAVSFAHEDTHTPMLSACCGLATAIVGGLLLFPHFGYVGAAAAIAVSAWVGAVLLGLILRRRAWLQLDALAEQRLPRIVLACVVMSAVIIVAAGTLFPAAAVTSGDYTALFALVVLGIAVYALSLRVLGVAKLTDLLAALRG